MAALWAVTNNVRLYLPCIRQQNNLVASGAIVTGSHCDAIPHAGMYDGTLGVIGAIAAVKGLQDAGFNPRRSIEVLFFTSEEPTRFGFGCIGRCSLVLSWAFCCCCACTFFMLQDLHDCMNRYDMPHKNIGDACWP